MNNRQCFYIKIYLSFEQHDSFLVKHVGPLLKEVLVDGGFDRFFFIRYSDPKPHLRLRFFGTPSCVRGPLRKLILRRLRAALPKEKGNKITASRYRAEVKRYGGRTGVQLSEQLFHASSIAVLKYLSLISNGAKISRVEFSIASSEVMLEALGLDFEKRRKFFASSSFSTEERQTQDLGKLAVIFNPIYTDATANPSNYGATQKSDLNQILLSFTDDVKLIAKGWQSQQGLIQPSLLHVANSYYHMHFNRIGLAPTEEIVIRCTRKMFALKEEEIACNQ
jgi:lantibiotic biosynthesis protein